MLTEQMKVAAFRSVIQAFIQFGGVFFATYSVADAQAALVAGALAAFIALGYRGVAEGSFDSARDAAGKVQSSDVTPNTGFDVNDPRLGINRVNRER